MIDVNIICILAFCTSISQDAGQEQLGLILARTTFLTTMDLELGLEKYKRITFVWKT